MSASVAALTALLLAAASATATAEATPPPCKGAPAVVDACFTVHGRLGVYNAECPLAELAAVHAVGWVPEPLAIESPQPAALPVAVTSSEWVPSPLPSLTDSRAPPLA